MAVYGDKEERKRTFDGGLWIEGVRVRVETFNCCLVAKVSKIVWDW